MALDEKPSYLKAAFMNVYNLGLFGGAVAASVMTGDYAIGAVAAGVEALWLLFGPDMKPFQRAVNQSHREDLEKQERERTEALMRDLPERDWARAKALDELRKEIHRDMEHNPSFQAILFQTELDKLTQLFKSFVTLATACVRAETYLSASDPRDLNRQIEIQKNLQKSLKDAAAVSIAQKNLQVLEKRIDTIKDIQNFLARARGQMNLIENSVRLLRDQVLTMQSPDQLGDQLDDLLTGVDAIQESVRENEDVFRMQPITAVSTEAVERGPSTKVRE